MTTTSLAIRKTKITTLLGAVSLFGFSAVLHAQNTLVNGGFEMPVTSVNWFTMDEGLVPGWETTATDNLIEYWKSGYSDFSGGPVPSYEGGQFAEINAWQNAALFQDAVIDVVGLVDYSFAHRGRQGVDVLRVDITYLGVDALYGTADDLLVVDGGLASNQYSAGQAWEFHYNDDAFTSVAGGTYRFSYGVVSSVGGDIARGNFIDDVRFGVAVVPEPAGVALLGVGALLTLTRRRRS